MLRRLELGNFKSWERLEMDLKPITLIFGANSSGKTAVLDSLLMLKQTAESTDRGRSLCFEGHADLGSYEDLAHKRESNRELTVAAEWSHPAMSYAVGGSRYVFPNAARYEGQWQLNGEVGLRRLAYVAGPVRASVERADKGEYVAAARSDAEDAVGQSPDSLVLPSGPESCHILPRAMVLAWPQLDLIEFSHQFELMLDSIRYLGPLRVRPRRVYQWSGEAPGSILNDGSSAVEALIAGARSAGERPTDAASSLVAEAASWLEQFGLAEGFSVAPIDSAGRFYEVRLTVPGAGDIETVLPDVGFGVSQLLPVVVQMLFAPEGSILLFEQPEIHLHPRAAAELADLFLQVAEQRNLQLIIETHSEYLLSRLQRRIAEAESELANPDSVAIYFCELREGASHLEPLRVNPYGQIENWPEGFFGDSIGDLEAMAEAMLARKRNGE